MAIYPSKYAQIPTADLNSWNTDRDVEPVVMTRGVVYKTGGSYYIWDGQSRSDDAGLNRVSAIGVTVTTSPLSCDSSSVSAFQDNPTRLKVSCFSDDAGKMRVSALGVTITGVLSANQSISALNLEGSAFMGQVSAILKDNPVNATYLGRVSLVDNPTNATYLGRTSSIQLDATNQMVSARLTDDTTVNKFFGRMSAISEGANLMRVSVITGSMVSARLMDGTANIGSVSVIGSCSATMKEGTAFIGQVSAILKDNPVNATYLGRVSGIIDSGSVSAKSGDAVNLNVSCKSNDAGTLRTSSYIPVDTVGQLTIGRLSNLSSSGVIKATAGTVYGYYAYNTTTTPQYINLTNTSGAINVGTDAIMFKAMIPASAAANVWFGQGLKGFTAGIGAYATSAISDAATTPCATSAVGINLLYN